MATKKIEDGIRAYLDSLGQTTKPIVDKEGVKALKAQIRDETDALAKLRLLASLEEAEQGTVPDNSGDKAVFVSEAKAWAEGEGIPVSAFQAMGVPDEVLKEAGFTVTAASKAKATTRASGGTRAKRMTLDEVLPFVQKLGSGWAVSDLADAIGREKGTTTNYVKALLKDGKIVEAGERPNPTGQGRAAKLYAIA